MSLPLVSIVIPTYGASPNIIRALDSALNQTYNNIEIIIVDDNGENTKNQKATQAMVQKYISGRTKYIVHKENRNGAYARNTGMLYSSGEFISFLDDDDYLYPEKIEHQVALFSSLDSTYGMVYCSGYLVDIKGKKHRLKIIDERPVYHLLTGKLRFNSSMIMIRKSVFDQIGGFDVSYRRHQDWEYSCRIFDTYKSKALPEWLVDKHASGGNAIKDPAEYYELKTFFMKNMEPIISKLSPIEQRRIKHVQYRDVAELYYSKKDYRGCTKVFQEYGYSAWAGYLDVMIDKIRKKLNNLFF